MTYTKPGWHCNRSSFSRKLAREDRIYMRKLAAVWRQRKIRVRDLRDLGYSDY